MKNHRQKDAWIFDGFIKSPNDPISWIGPSYIVRREENSSNEPKEVLGIRTGPRDHLNQQAQCDVVKIINLF